MSNRPLHIVHLASGDLWAGAEVVLYQLVREQHSDPTVNVSVILLNSGRLQQELESIGIKTEVIDENTHSSISLTRRVYTCLKSRQANIVHTHRLKENVVGAACTLFLKNCESMRTVHGGPEHAVKWFDVRKRVFGSLDRFIARFLQARVVFVSDELGRRLQRRYRYAQTCIIENGIDVEAQIAHAGNADQSQDDIQTPYVLFAGRLSKVKRLDIFLDAAKELIRDNSVLTFVVAGDGPARSSAEAYVAAEALESQIKILGFRDDISRLLRAASALVICSDHEGLPMIALEAMALKTLVIYRPVGGLDDLFESGRAGVKWQPTDASLAETIASVERLGASAREIEERAFEVVSQTYSVESMARKYSSVYREIFSG